MLSGLAGVLTVRLFLSKTPKLVKALPEIARHLEFELENVRYAHTRSGVKKWELSTDRARRLKNSDEIELSGVKARVYADGRLESDTVIQAVGGAYKVDSGDMVLSGDIHILNPEFSITTSKIEYYEATELISAPEKLTFNSEKLTIEANRARLDLPRQQLHMEGQVKARFLVAAGAHRPALVESKKPLPANENPRKAIPAEVVKVEPVVEAASVEKEALPRFQRPTAGLKGKRKHKPDVPKGKH